jgi:hypothetical protein
MYFLFPLFAFSKLTCIVFVFVYEIHVAFSWQGSQVWNVSVVVKQCSSAR